MFTRLEFGFDNNGIPIPFQVDSSFEDIVIWNGKLATQQDGLLPVVECLNQQENVQVRYSLDGSCSPGGRCPHFGHYHVVMDAWSYAGQSAIYEPLNYFLQLGHEEIVFSRYMRFEKVRVPRAVGEFMMRLNQLEVFENAFNDKLALLHESNCEKLHGLRLI